MDVKVYPQQLNGEINAISSKSLAQRIFLAAALADKPTVVYLNKSSLDIEATMGCLVSLGAKIEQDGMRYVVTPVGNNLNKNAVLDLGESGTAMRFLLPVCGALGVNATLLGHGRLPERPIEHLIDSLNGVQFSSKNVPLKMQGQVKSGEFVISGEISSQYISGLLFALPVLDGDSKVIIKGKLNSKSYVDMTIDVLKKFSVEIVEKEYGYEIKGNQQYKTTGYAMVEGDYSNSAFYLAGNIIGNRVRVLGLNPDSVQGDKKIKELLLAFNSQGTVLEVSDTPDLVPILSVVGCYASSKTVITGAGRLRLKESDRLEAMKENLNKVGGNVKVTEDGLEIQGMAGLKGGAEVESYNDHRIVMSMAIAATFAKEPIIIKGAQAVNKSYPEFFEDFAKLGGKCEILN